MVGASVRRLRIALAFLVWAGVQSGYRMLIQEYMRTNVVTIARSATFRDALERLLDHKTNGMIVVQSEEDPTPVGVVSSFHLVKAAVPAHLHERADLAQFAGGDQFKEWVRQVESWPLSDVMQPVPHDWWLHEDDTIEKAAALSAQEDLMYVPVVNRSNHALIGLVSRTDMKKAMAHSIGHAF